MKTLALILMISLTGATPAALWAAPKKDAVETVKKKSRRAKSKRKSRRTKNVSSNKSKAQVLNRDPVFQEGESLPPPQTPKDE